MPLIELASNCAVSLVIAVLRLYQRLISPYLGASCRFYPSCSEYSIQAFEKHGLFFGAAKTLFRIGKCHPFHPGGYDPII